MSTYPSHIAGSGRLIHQTQMVWGLTLTLPPPRLSEVSGTSGIVNPLLSECCLSISPMKEPVVPRALDKLGEGCHAPCDLGPSVACRSEQTKRLSTRKGTGDTGLQIHHEWLLTARGRGGSWKPGSLSTNLITSAKCRGLEQVITVVPPHALGTEISISRQGEIISNH